MPPSAKKFELRMGRAGILFFVLGFSIMALAAFLLGVVVGKNIETYPEKIASVVPGKLRQKVFAGSVTGPEEADKGQDEKVPLSFYDRLTGKAPAEKLEQQKRQPAPEAAVKDAPAQEAKPGAAPAAVESAAAAGKFSIQVAALKEEKKAQELRKKISAIGYQTVLETSSGTRGTLYKVIVRGLETQKQASEAAGAIEDKTGIKCIVKKD